MQVILLLLAGYIIFAVDKKKENFPVPMILVLLGIGLSFIPYFAHLEVSKDILYDIFLPGLLFVSAYKYPPRALRRHAGVIAVLSTIGLLVTALLLGMAIYAMAGLFGGLSFVGALLIASVLTPTDPVSVVSILKQSSIDEGAADVVDGESMINDGTSVVLFGVLAGMYTEGRAFEWQSFLGEFLQMGLGGALLGVGIGWLLSKTVHVTHHREYQVMLSIVAAYGVFHLAELLGMSGVLAVVASGIMLGWEFEHTNKEDHYREALDGFWNVVEPTILSLVFLLIGIQAMEYLAWDVWGLAAGILALSLVIRFVVIILTMESFRGWRDFNDWRTCTLIAFSGIRGTVSVVLLLTLVQEASFTGETRLILSLSFAVVLLSLVLQSLGIYPLAKRLGSGGKD
ncbi:cation:proton antiporter [Paenibacillus sp. 1P07SE]|uniref:cation:proton antiporter n=1 Tax=Paenibacillus sp. 1P07SE TaxID=3132209 RepID=UPI0039A706BE